jgi:PTH1 family peptidyl-tRNA hydrolase
MAVEELARRASIALTRGGHHSQWGEGRGHGRKLILALPQTYMNLSGQAATSLMAYFDIAPSRLVVAHDDLDLAPGQLKVALRGGAGGHKGVASIIQALGDDRFLRVKIGIGRPRFGEAVEDFVLSGPYPDQREALDKAVSEAADCLEVILSHGPAEAMQRFHRRPGAEGAARSEGESQSEGGKNTRQPGPGAGGPAGRD